MRITLDFVESLVRRTTFKVLAIVGCAAALMCLAMFMLALWKMLTWML